MKKTISILFMGLVLASLFVIPVMAKPEKVDGFVCPVLGGKGGENAIAKGKGKFIEIFDGDVSIAGPNVHVPVHATNDNGAGSPGGAHTSPGDTEYTAIWARARAITITLDLKL